MQCKIQTLKVRYALWKLFLGLRDSKMKLFLFATFFGIAVATSLVPQFLILTVAIGTAAELNRPQWFY